jgi:hypothetical protein
MFAQIELFIDEKGRPCLLITIGRTPYAIQIEPFEYQMLLEQEVPVIKN